MKYIPAVAATFCGLLLSSATSRAQDLYVGSNAANVTTNFTSGTNTFYDTYVGYTTNATNNLLNVSGVGTVLTNTDYLSVGYAGSGNRLVISNGGQVFNRIASIGAGDLALRPFPQASNNSALVTGTNSRWTVSGLEVGFLGDASSLVISNGGQVSSYYGVRIGAYASGNSVLVSGAGSSLLGSVQLGDTGGHYNTLVVSNGGTIVNTDPISYGDIGYFSSNNTVLVTGSGSAWTDSSSIQIGIWNNCSGNRLIISNGGTVTSAGGIIGAGNMMTDPPYAPPPSGDGNNSVLVTGTNSLWTSSGNLVVGRYSDGNSLTISDGGSVVCGTNLIINQYYPNTDGNYAGSLVLVQSGRLSVTNGQINFGAGRGFLQVDGGTVEVKQLLATNPITPSGQITPAERVGSFVLLNGGTIISGATTISNGNSSDDSTFYVGGTNGSGASFVAEGGTHTFWADVTVGRSGSNNSLIITNGAEVFLKSRPDPNSGPSGGTNLVIGVASGASNNSVSISSGRLVMTNGTLEIGRAGSGILNVHNGGTVQAPNVVVASQAGSSGTLNIGRFGTNDSAGTISSATIAFGAGTGVVNFNQSNAVTITSVISGAGTVRQLGSGTTTLSASNTYTGSTTISAGTLELDSAGWVAGSISNNATLSLNRTNTLTLTNLVSGTGALSKSGTGTVILAAANTYSGNTTISAGTLQINAGGSVSNSATTLVGSGGAGTLSISGGTYSNTSVSIGHSGGTGILNLNSGSLSAQNLAVSGNGAVAGTLNLNGGTMAVSGSFYVASGGTINVNSGGVLSGGNDGQLWVDATNSLVNFNGGTGSSGLNLFVGNGGTVDLRGQSLGSNNWANLVASGLGGVLRNSGTNAATIANPNTIWLWEGGQRLTIDASGGDILINSWITSSLMTNTGIIKTGTNALILANSANDYNGGSFLQQGILRLDHANAAGSGAITQSNAGSTLQINATGTVTNAMSLYNIATLQTVTLSGAKTLNGATYNVAAGTTTTESGVLSGAGGLTKSGTGTMTLSASNTYTGDTAIGSGVLALTNGSAIADTAAVNNSGATLRVDSSETIGSLRGSGSTVLNGAAVVLTVAETNSQTYAGVISGAGGITKSGIGRLSLSGSSSYNGATAVSAGELNLSGGSIANSAVTVASGASLSGYGSVGTIGGAGAINPGNSPGILTTPQVDPSGGTDFNLEMTGTAPTYNNASNSVNDVIRITGATPFSQALAAGNGVFIYFSGAALFTGSAAVQYQGGFFTDQSTNFASSISGATYNYYFANSNGPTTYNGASYYNKTQYESLVLGTNMLITVSTVAQTANFGSGNVNGQVMQIDVIPEPSTYALLVLAVIGLGVQCWRRRKLT
jgi:autotransporter-associated beta strand protein/T5SS/PEP-CTERM-associated repeat protein